MTVQNCLYSNRPGGLPFFPANHCIGHGVFIFSTYPHPTFGYTIFIDGSNGWPCGLQGSVGSIRRLELWAYEEQGFGNLMEFSESWCPHPDSNNDGLDGDGYIFLESWGLIAYEGAYGKPNITHK